jgi:hypothetical protein
VRCAVFLAATEPSCVRFTPTAVSRLHTCALLPSPLEGICHPEWKAKVDLGVRGVVAQPVLYEGATAPTRLRPPRQRGPQTESRIVRVRFVHCARSPTQRVACGGLVHPPIHT